MNEVVNIVRNVADDLKLGKCGITVNNITQKGEGYLSSIWSSRVRNDDTEMNFIIKTSIDVSDPEEQKDIKIAFQSEVYVYNVIFPVFEQLQKENKVKDAFNCYPKCFATSLLPGEEALVFSNLTTEGYRLWDRFTPLNEDHTVAVLKEYGRLHALSYALREQKPQIFQRITEGMQSLIEFSRERRLKPYFGKTLDEVEDLLNTKGNKLAAKKIAALRSEIDEISTYANKQDPHSVVLHGDCWNNNRMYKYEGMETTKPKSVRFLDWQISHCGSPVLDVSYFLYSCCSKTIFDKLDTCLCVYYESLSSFLKELGSDPENVFSFDAFMEHWKKYRKYGLLWSLLVLKFALANKDEMSDDADERIQQIINSNSDGKYFERIKYVIEHFVDNNYI